MNFLNYSNEELEEMLDDIKTILYTRKENEIKQIMFKISQTIEELIEASPSVYFTDREYNKIPLTDLKELNDEKYNVIVKMDFNTLMR